MVKASNPWLRSLLRVGKKQQRTLSRALTSLIAPTKPKARSKAAKPKVTATAKALAKPKPVARSGPLVWPPAPVQPKSPVIARPKAVARPASTPGRTGKPTAAVRGAAPRSVAAAPKARKPPLTPKLAPLPGKWLAAQYAGQYEQGTLARHLRYWLYIPSTAPLSRLDGPGMPLVVMLHGCEQSATQFADGSRMNRLAEAAGCAVLYPQQSLTAHAHRCWKWYERATQQGGGDVPMIVGMVRQVAERYPVDPTRIYIGGISAGAAMAHLTALNHPDLFAAVGLHSSPMFGAGHSPIGALGVMQHGAGTRVDGAMAEVMQKRPKFPALPAILIHGEDDKVVRPINQTQLVRQEMLVNQLTVASKVIVTDKAASKRTHAYRLRDVYQGRKVMLRVASIANLGHAWSGGDDEFKFNSRPGPDASKMMLAFFARHRRTV
jgi:poly(hydroxyalkanoate) depolymerase family esterase